MFFRLCMCPCHNSLIRNTQLLQKCRMFCPRSADFYSLSHFYVEVNASHSTARLVRYNVIGCHCPTIFTNSTKNYNRLFLKYEKGKCCAVPVDINNIGSIPSKIATFLNFPNPSQYTGHCFRRSSATLLANRGGDLLTLKRHGGWKSGTVAESYVADSLKRKINVAHMMTEAGPSGSKRPAFQVHSGPSTIQEDSSIEVGSTNKSTTEVNQLMPGLFSDVQNCTINVTINLYK
jgi:hypothetical protein